MSEREIGMRKLKELLRFKCLGMSRRETERALKVSGNTVKRYWGRAAEKGVIYTEEITEEELEQKLIIEFGNQIPAKRLDHCNWKELSEEVSRSKAGLNILWEEEVSAGRFHLSYSQFCRRFEKHNRRNALSFHKEYEAGKVGEVDFCDGLDVVDLKTGEVKSTNLFLMTLGASRNTYAEFCLRQDLPTWLDLHAHAFEYFGGVPETIVPDNLKAGVNKACRYEPELNPTYTEFACHYGFVVIPARVRKPKDKPLVERSALAFQKWFYQKYRHRQFWSVAELNEQLWNDLKIYNNDKIHRRFGESRQARFDRIEKEKLKHLPEKRFEMTVWKKAKVHPDCHVAFELSFYSAPHSLRGEYLDVRATSTIVELYRKGRRSAAHARSYKRGYYVTNKEHLPPEHQSILEITPQNLLRQAGEIGESTEQMIRELLAKHCHPSLAIRSCQGVISLKRRYDSKRLEAACKRALEYRALSYKAVSKILMRGLDHENNQGPEWNCNQRLLNSNLRGKDYFH